MRARLTCRLLVALWGGASLACGEDGARGGPAPRVHAVTELGVMEMSPLVRGRDGGYSARLWGRSIWVYGDTILSAADEDGLTWHHNSFSFTDDASAADGLAGFAERPDAAGAPRHVLAPTATERAFNLTHTGDACAEPCGARYAAWPSALIDDPARDRALLFYGLVYAEPGDFNFRGVGGGIATWEGFDADLTRPEVAPGAEHPTLLFGADEPAFGAAAFTVGEDVLAFGCVLDFLSQRCLLGRVPLDAALDRSAWRFWDGGDWVVDWRRASFLFDGASMMSVGFNRHLGTWTVIHPVPLTRKVVMRTASAPTGPWSEPIVLFTATTDAEMAYDVLAHAEYEEADGRILYLTHSRPTGFLASEMALYRIELE